MAEDDRNPIRVAYERRNPDLDPQLVWRGKDEQNWSDLVVQAPPLFIQEKVQPKVLIDEEARISEAEETSRFETLEGALACLMEDFHLTGLDVQNDYQMML